MSHIISTFWRKETFWLFLTALLLGSGLDILLYQSPLRPLLAEVRFFGVFFPLALCVLLPLLLHSIWHMRVQRLLLPKSLTLSLLLFFLGALLPFFFTKDVFLHAGHLALWVIWLLLTIVLSTSKKRRSAFAVGLILSGIFVSVLALLQLLTQGSLGLHMLGEAHFSLDRIGSSTLRLGDLSLQRGYGLFPHPNIAFAWISTALLALFSFGGIFSWKEYPERCVAFFLLTVGLLATGSKSLILLLVSCFCAWVFSSISERGLKQKLVTWITVTLAFLLPLAYLLFLLQGTDTLVDRFSFLQNAWMIFSHSPLGVGLGSMSYETSQLANQAPWMMQPVHSSFLLLFVEGGIFAGAGWLAFFSLLLVTWRTMSHATSLPHRQEMFLPLWILFFFVTTSFVDHYWATYAPLLFVSSYLIAMVISKHLARRAL